MNAQKLPVLFLSTYPPRPCGIATFTQDLVHALQKAGKTEPGVVAVNSGIDSYPPEVRFTLEQENPDSYLEAGEQINRSGAALHGGTRIRNIRRKFRGISFKPDQPVENTFCRHTAHRSAKTSKKAENDREPAGTILPENGNHVPRLGRNSPQCLRSCSR